MNRLLPMLLGLSLGACVAETPALDVPAPDAQEFALSVYPILLRDCGFPACHGAQGRFFQVLGPGRRRELGTTLAGDPATESEILQTYTRARSMLANTGSIEASLFLRKPLAKSAGGAGHEGHDNWGRNVYATTQDPAYLVLREWALSARDAQGAVP